MVSTEQVSEQQDPYHECEETEDDEPQKELR